jgi:hypothetical protein
MGSFVGNDDAAQRTCFEKIRDARLFPGNVTTPLSMIVSPTNFWPRPDNRGDIEACVNQAIEKVRETLPILTPRQAQLFGFASQSVAGWQFCHYPSRDGKFAAYRYSGGSGAVNMRMCQFLGGLIYTHTGDFLATCRGRQTFADLVSLRECARTDPNLLSGSLLKQFSTGRYVFNGGLYCSQVFKHMMIQMSDEEFDLDLTSDKRVKCNTTCYGKEITDDKVQPCVERIVTEAGWTNVQREGSYRPDGVVVSPTRLWATTSNVNDLGVCLAPLIYTSQVKSVTYAQLLNLAEAIGTTVGQRFCVYPAISNSYNGFWFKTAGMERVCMLSGGKSYAYGGNAVLKRDLHSTGLQSRHLVSLVASMLAPFSYSTLGNLFDQLKLFYSF